MYRDYRPIIFSLTCLIELALMLILPFLDNCCQQQEDNTTPSQVTNLFPALRHLLLATTQNCVYETKLTPGNNFVASISGFDAGNKDNPRL